MKIKPSREPCIRQVADIGPMGGLGFSHAFAVDYGGDGRDIFAIADAPSLKTKAAEPAQFVCGLRIASATGRRFQGNRRAYCDVGIRQPNLND